ncbi:ATP-binding protein [Parahaliea maris]|uniref:ATP-binding protein n=1 Tax=Parahaliea maris TaxID=2716870 RepID=A0A5C9A2A4_9GAMM|nr:ATP-binding protein [Parahaliea maris]TXS94082.1 ATP-binding protein [Parahaliea maris]
MKLSLNRELSEIERIVAARRAYFAKHNLPGSLAYTVDLATEELFVNMIRHNNQAREKIILEFEAVDNGISVRLTDREITAFDPASAAPADIATPLEERAVGGLGLHLVRQLVGAVHCERRDDRTTLSFLARKEAAHV